MEELPMKKKHIVLTIFLISMLTALLSCAVSADSNCQILKPGKTYRIDLDGNGKKEKIRYTADKTARKDGTKVKTLLLKINNKKVLSEVPSYDKDYMIVVTDVQKKDKQRELFVINAEEGTLWKKNGSVAFDPEFGEEEGFVLSYIKYYTYKKGRLKFRQDIGKLVNDSNLIPGTNFDLHPLDRKQMFKVNGSGKLTLLLCTSRKDGLDYVYGFSHINYQLQLKNGRFRCPAKSYYSCRQKYVKVQTEGALTSYKTPACKKVSYVFPHSARFYIVGIAVTSGGKCRYRVTNGHGGGGYITMHAADTGWYHDSRHAWFLD